MMKAKRNTSSIPMLGKMVMYMMEDGELINGECVGIDHYDWGISVAVKKDDGEIYKALIRRQP